MGGSSGGGNSTTTTKADPWVGVQPYLTDAYGQLSNLYNNGADPQYYPGSTVASPSGLEQVGQQQQLAQQGNVAGLAGTGIQNTNTMAGMGDLGSKSGYGYANQAASGMTDLANQTAGGATTANSAANSLSGYGTGNTQTGANGTINAMNQLTAAGDPTNNPYLAAATQAAIRPVTQQFQETVMPGIKQGAQDAGQMGGSRQGIAEGIAARGYQDTVGNITANMGNNAYNQGLSALSSAGSLGQGLANSGLGATSTAGSLGTTMAGLSGNMQSNLGNLGSSLYSSGNQALGQSTALIPGTQQAQLASGQIASTLGQQNTADAQAQLTDQVNRWNYNQNLPYTMLQDYLTSLNGGANLGGTSTASQSGGGSSRAAGALGGAASGAAMGTAIAPGMGTAIGAGAGALYGLFM